MFIGIDLGTSAVKTILIDEKQNTLSSHTEKIELLNPYSGYYEQDPECWYTATIKCFNKIKSEKPKEFSAVQSLGISGQMHGATLIDKNNKVLRPCILWNDTRSINQCIEMEKSYPDIRNESGNVVMPGFTAPKILWIKENEKEIFKKIYKVLLPKDYLRYRLSNSYYTDMSDASGTLWLNVAERKWSDKLLGLTELSKNNMPSLVEGNEKTSVIDKKLANSIGFKNEVIIAGGAGDQAAGAAGSGVINSSQSVISLGTSGVYFSPTDDFVTNTNQAVHSFCHCVPNTWHHMSVMLSATNCIDWICKILNITIDSSIKKIEDYSKNKFNEHSTPYFLPYLTGERTPHNSAYLRGSFHLLDTSASHEAILYSVLEGISFGIKDGYESVHAISQKSDEIYLVGGGSKNFFWANLLSSLLNQDILIGENSNMGPALGVARLAMLATKEYEKKEVIKSMNIIKEIKKNDIMLDRLDKRYKKWKEIVNINLPIAKKLME
tara:strand:- start:5646 stop:7127 length:1482 start_codon:yes stop_codon:yes gene_type:complete